VAPRPADSPAQLEPQSNNPPCDVPLLGDPMPSPTAPRQALNEEEMEELRLQTPTPVTEEHTVLHLEKQLQHGPAEGVLAGLGAAWGAA
jgi:hypothetical protein